MKTDYPMSPTEQKNINILRKQVLRDITEKTYRDPDDSLKKKRTGIVNGKKVGYDLASLAPNTVDRKIFTFIGRGTMANSTREYSFFTYKKKEKING